MVHALKKKNVDHAFSALGGKSLSPVAVLEENLEKGNVLTRKRIISTPQHLYTSTSVIQGVNRQACLLTSELLAFCSAA